MCCCHYVENKVENMPITNKMIGHLELYFILYFEL